MKNQNNILLVAVFSVLIIVSSFYPAHALTEMEKRQLYEKGESLFSNGSFREALSIYEKILDDDSTYSDAVGAKAAVFHRWGDYDSAIKYYDIAISLNSTNPFFLNDRGSALLSLGDDVEAEKSLNASLSLFPGFVDALNGLANVYSYRQDYQNELQYRQAVLIVDPQNIEAMIGVGNALLAMGNYVESVRQYDLALLQDSTNVNVLIGLGNAHFEMSEYSSALEFYDSALDLDPQNVNAMRGSSLAHLHMGNVDDSVRLNQQSNELEQNQSNFANQKIPNWVKNVFIWYAQDQISEDDVLNAIEYLLEEKFILLN